MQVSGTFCAVSPPTHRPLLDTVDAVPVKDHYSLLASSCISENMYLNVLQASSEAFPHSHVAYATASDAVSSSPVDTDKTLTRSHLSSGIVDERQTHVWPEFFESAQTSTHARR